MPLECTTIVEYRNQNSRIRSKDKDQFRAALALQSRPIASLYSALTLGSSIARTLVDHETAIHTSTLTLSRLFSAP